MKTNRTVIVQCRLSSTRLPGKAVKELGGKTVLAWVLSSMKKVHADHYFVATDEEVPEHKSFEEVVDSMDDYEDIDLDDSKYIRIRFLFLSGGEILTESGFT